MFCNEVHITTVWVHQIVPLTHKYSHTNTSSPNDRVTGLWYRTRLSGLARAEFDKRKDKEWAQRQKRKALDRATDDEKRQRKADSKSRKETMVKKQKTILEMMNK